MGGASSKPLFATVSSKGQVCLPVRIREAYQIEKGSLLEFKPLGTDTMLVRILHSEVKNVDNESFATVRTENGQIARKRPVIGIPASIRGKN